MSSSLAKQTSLAISDITDGLRHAQLWSYLAIHDIAARYRRTLLGPFWVAGTTLATGTALAIVYGALFGMSMQEAMPYILCGIVAWTFFTALVIDGSGAFIGAAGSIKTVALPLTWHIWRHATVASLVFLHNLVGLVCILAFILRGIYFHWTFLPGVLLFAAACVTWSLPLAFVAARYRDIAYLIGYIGQVAFFLTPIFWKPEGLQGARSVVVEYNPLFYMINLIRQPLMGMPPTMLDWLWSLGVFGSGLSLGVLALIFFRRRLVFWV